MIPAGRKRVKKKKSETSKEILRRLEEYLNSGTVTGEPVRILCGFWEDQQNAVTYQELRQMVLDGTVDEDTLRLWRQDYAVLVATQMPRLWNNAIKAGSVSQPVLDGRGFVFDMQTPGIMDWIDRRGASFVTACTEEQQAAISALLTKKMRDSHTVDELARMIRPCIGLTEAQTKANVRYYDNIVASLKADHPRMSAASIRKKAMDASLKYAERQHRQRAMTIAQTESAFAYNRGADEGIRQAQEKGYLGIMQKKWSSSGDESVCKTCSALDGTVIGMDEEFEFGVRNLFDGYQLVPPAHPLCACAIEYIEVSRPVTVPDPQQTVTGQPDPETGPENEGYIYLGSLENTSPDVVKLVMEEYENTIAESTVEHAVVITKSGLMWQRSGSKNNVLLDAGSGIELDGAYVTHNHPVGSINEYSFSSEDIAFFMENNLSVLRGIDERYVYELTRDSSMLDEHVSLEELYSSDGSLARHEKVIDIARKRGIGYRRWRR